MAVRSALEILEEAFEHLDRLDERKLDYVEILQDAQDDLPAISRENRAFEQGIASLRAAGLDESQLQQLVDAQAWWQEAGYARLVDLETASELLPELNRRRNDLVALIQALSRIAHEQDPNGVRRFHDRRERQSTGKRRPPNPHRRPPIR
jgi:hypothetical protein